MHMLTSKTYTYTHIRVIHGLLANIIIATHKVLYVQFFVCALARAGKKAEEINSRHFILWSADLFRKTNSNNVNIKRIKDTLNKWAEEVGVHEKFKREASRVSYKRAIFFYFIFSIQTYNLG